MKNANTEIITQTRVFSDSEIKVAENMLKILAKAMGLTNIQDKMHIASKYRKNRITLLKDDGTIREGWRKYSPILYRTR